MMKLLSHAPVDGAADQMGKRFINDTLPPVFTEGTVLKDKVKSMENGFKLICMTHVRCCMSIVAEKQKSIHGSGEHWSVKDQRVRGAVELDPDTQIKLIRKGVIRYDISL